MDIGTFLLIAAVTLGASCIQSTTGFGFGIFAMIFLPSLLQYTEANILSTVLSTLTSLFALFSVYKNISFKNLIFPNIGCLVATYVAVEFIKAQSNELLTLLLGVALFLLSIYFFFFSSRIRIKPTWYAGLIAGVLSGILGGMFSIGGPPVVIYYLQSEETSERYFATISSYFVVSGIITTVTKAAMGFVTPNVLLAIPFALVGMLIGAVVGKFARDKTDPVMIKKAVYAVMAVSGIINIVTSSISLLGA